MDFSALFRRIFMIFFTLGVILPFFSTLLFLFALILGSLGDEGGRVLLNHLAWIGVALWLADMFSLILMLGLDRLFKFDQK